MQNLTDKQRQAREAFDLDATFNTLPAATTWGATSPTHRGQAGVRLRACLVADISDDLLREFARVELKALRCSEQYLDALRVVLGNQADAERFGYVLEMNRRVPFAPQNIMRTIIDQMQAAGITFGKVVGLGSGRNQLVQCYASAPVRPVMNDSTSDAAAASELERMDRQQEAADDAPASTANKAQRVAAAQARMASTGITAADVPY